MNVHLEPTSLASKRDGRPDPPQDDETRPRTLVCALILVTCITSPALALASGALAGGFAGLAMVSPVAALLYVALVLNDTLVIREAMAGRWVLPSLLLRAVVPIAGTALTSIPLFMVVFGADIDQEVARERHAVVAPIRSRIAEAIDADILSLRDRLNAAMSERTTLTERIREASEPIQRAEEADRNSIYHWEEVLRQQALVLSCEADGSKCSAASSNYAGLNGPVSKLARHRIEDAKLGIKQATERLSEDEKRLREATIPTEARLQVLEGAATSPDSIAGLQARLEIQADARDKLVQSRLDAEPAVQAAMSPPGLGHRLILLLTVVLAQPAVLVPVLFAKAFLTVVELFGLCRGLGFAQDSLEGQNRRRSGREALLDQDSWRIDRRTAKTLARLKAKTDLWMARKDFKERKIFDKVAGLRSTISGEKNQRR